MDRAIKDSLLPNNCQNDKRKECIHQLFLSQRYSLLQESLKLNLVFNAQSFTLLSYRECIKWGRLLMIYKYPLNSTMKRDFRVCFLIS